jgi:hypothetical protein
MSTEMLRQALEKIARVNACDYEYQAWAREALNHCEDNLDMVKQEQGEPVGCVVHMLGMTVGYLTKEVPIGTHLYTAPQRTWVDLTPEEVSDIAINNPPAVHDFYQAIADALKKKNGYST